MRLLMTGDTVGGVLTFVTELAKGLTKQGWRVTVATFGGEEPLPALGGVRWFHLHSKLEWQADPWADLQRAAIWLRSLVRSEQPDLLHFNTLCHGDLGWEVPLVATIHSCVPTWWSQVKETKLPADWDRYCRVVSRSLRDASLLVTPSQALLDSLKQAWTLSFSDAMVIPNGLEPSLFHISDKQPFILSAGRLWDEGKNIRALNDAAAAIDWPVYLAGEGGPASNCRLLGQLEQRCLADYYASASIYVSTSTYEPFGLTILEAAMSGCALVLSDIPSFRENWSGAAIFFQPGGLAHTLQELITNPAMRVNLQQQALSRSKRFTRSAMTANYIAAYQRVGSYICAS